MARNNSVQVFEGGWKELEDAIFTDNQEAIPSTASAPLSFFIRPDGTEIFILNNDNDTVETFPLTTPYDPDTVGSIGNTFTITDDNAPIGISFKFDGTKMFIGGDQNKVMLEYVLPVPWDVSSIVDSPVSLSLTPITTVFNSTFSENGDFFFVVDGVLVFSFPLPIPWDITSNTSNTSFNSGLGFVISLAFKREGDKMYLLSLATGIVTEFTLSTVHDITTAVANGNTIALQPLGIAAIDITFRSNGREFFAFEPNKDLSRLHLDEQWNISTAFFFRNSVSSVDLQSLAWKPDGTKYFTLISSAGDRIEEFTTTERWNQSIVTPTGSFVLTGIADTPRGIWVTPDGKTCIIADNASDSLVRLDMTTGWSLVTMSDPGISLLLTSLVPGLTNVTGVAFTKDQKTFYVTDSATDTVYQFTTAVPLDIVNAVYTGNFLPISGDTVEIRLKPDDNLMYVAERSGDNILLFRLPADGDVSQAVLLQTLPVGFLETNLQGFFIRENDGEKIWIVGLASGAIQSMDMSLDFNDAIINNIGDELVTDLGENLVHVQ